MIFAVLVLGLGIGFFAAMLIFAAVVGAKDDDVWLAGHAAGVRDERADRLARALWEADHLSTVDSQ